MHLSVVGWPKDGAGDEVEMGTSGLFSEGYFPNVEHVHDITDLRVLDVACAVGGGEVVGGVGQD